jgi:diguanylate cyclase (GGDEF)-like protein
MSAERLDLLCDRIIATVGDVIRSDVLRVYELDDEARDLVPRAVRHPRLADVILHGRGPRLGQGLSGLAASRREPLLVPQAHKHPHGIQVAGTPFVPEALIAIPLVARGRLSGALLASRFGERTDLYSAEDFELVCRFGALASVAFDNIRRRTEMEQLARTDELTGLANRRGLEEELNRAVALARRHDQPLALLYIDLDEFKNINDSYGHRVGDEVLREIASALRRRLRRGDRAARVGGDEYVVILPQTDQAGAAVLAHEVRKAIAKAGVRVDSGKANVSAAVGVAELAPGESAEALLDRADRRMYRDKR